ncbi:MAG: hypothetical protein KF832_09025 [Caldilineaceae bacterium]|nr:hypothetical protein [Caldilineaceae bacterium]
MTTISPLWQARWNAVNNAIEILLDRQRQDEMGSLRKQLIADLLGSLQHFGRHQFYFFYDGFGARQAINLTALDECDPHFSFRDFPFPHFPFPHFPFPHYMTGYAITDHILRITLDQIIEDVGVIQRAAEQRQLSHNGIAEGKAAQQDFFFALGETDRLALSVLWALHAYLPAVEQTTTITYFHKSAAVRVIPYMPVAMIGIPLTAVGINNQGERAEGVSQDLLAIPHEVGHYLYWNGQVNQQPLYQALAQQVIDPLVYPWREEIFADVISCLVGGAAATQSFMELMLGTIGHDFLATAGVYPTPALRPHIYLRTLAAMGQQPIATALATWWDKRLEERRIFVSRPHLYATYQLVDQILALIPPSTILSQWQWSDPATLAEIDPNYVAHKKRILRAIPIEALEPPSCGQPPSWQEKASELTAMQGRPSALAALAPDWVRQAEATPRASQGAVPIAPKDWLRIFEFNGWISAGPGPKQIGG